MTHHLRAASIVLLIFANVQTATAQTTNLAGAPAANPATFLPDVNRQIRNQATSDATGGRIAVGAAAPLPPGVNGTPVSQADSSDLVTTNDSRIDLKQQRKVWLDKNGKPGPGQTKRGFKPIDYEPGDIPVLFVGENAPATLILPEWETIAIDPLVGRPDYLAAVTPTKNTVELQIRRLGFDTPLKIQGESGMLYTFMVEGVPYDYSAATDIIIQVKANNPKPRPVRLTYSGAMAANSGMFQPSGGNPNAPMDPTCQQFPVDVPIPDYARAIIAHPCRIAVPHVMKEVHSGDSKLIGPKRVWEDGEWTYFDFGEDADTRPHPSITFVDQEVANPGLKFYTDPSAPQVIIVKKIGTFNLRYLDAAVCIIRTDDPRASLPRPVTRQ